MKNIEIVASLEVRQKPNFERAVTSFKAELKLNGGTMRYENFVGLYNVKSNILIITYIQNLL